MFSDQQFWHASILNIIDVIEVESEDEQANHLSNNHSFFCEIQILSVYSQFIAIVSQTYISKHVESPIKYHKYITIT
jgi:phosphate starvation-inducible membrane PsiE